MPLQDANPMPSFGGFGVNRDAETDSGGCGCFMTGVLILILLILIVGWFTGWMETWWNWLSPMIDGLLSGE